MEQSIETYDFRGKRAIVRVDFNVPLDKQFNVTDDTRIRAALPTIKRVLDGGGAVILMSHLGRPKGIDSTFSLRHILPVVTGLICSYCGREVAVDFADDCWSSGAQAKVRSLKMGGVLMLENLRFYAEEEGKPRFSDQQQDAMSLSSDQMAEAKTDIKRSQKEFTAALASYADCYINDAFGTAHRAHASTALIASHFPNDKMFGYVMLGELKAVDLVMEAPSRPFVAILGGSKVSSKITIIERLMEKVDILILGGGMTYTFRGAQGGHIGKSLCEKDQFKVALSLIAKAKERGVELVLADDAMCGDSFSNDCRREVCDVMNIPDNMEGMDIGPASIEKFVKVILRAKTILWNGPVGVFEMSNFAVGSRAVAQAIVDATAGGAYSLIGGGDSVACINQFGMADKVSYVSTGGGALLEYMEGSALPGVTAIRD